MHYFESFNFFKTLGRFTFEIHSLEDILFKEILFEGILPEDILLDDIIVEFTLLEGILWVDIL